MRLRVCIISSILVLIILIVTASQNTAAICSWQELRDNAQIYENSKITLQGYISPLLGGTHNYIYLMSTPYCKDINLSEDDENITNCIPVYFTSTEVTEYSGKLITVTGELNLNSYVDTNGYCSNFRLWNSKIISKSDYPEGEAFEEFEALIDSGVYDDLLMYKSLYEAVLLNMSGFEEVEDSKFDDMLIYLVAEGITPSEELTNIINKEKEIANKLADSKDITDDYIELGDCMDQYFSALEVN